MRDLSNPLAPSIFKGEGRKRRQAKRTAKIASNKEKMEANKNKTKTVSKNTGFSVVNESVVKGFQGKPNCGKGSGTKGSCDNGNLRAEKSEVVKGKKFSNKRTISKNRLVQSKETKENNKLREKTKKLEKKNKQQAPKIRKQEDRQKEKEARKNTRNPKKKTSEIGPFITQKQRQQLKKK